MHHPTIRFMTNAEKDLVALRGFVRDARFDGGAALEQAVFTRVPALRAWFRGSRPQSGAWPAIEQTVRILHRKEALVIRRDMARYRRAWQRLAPRFFVLVEDIFGTVSWPAGKYAAYPTIWGMFPRFLNDKTFQVPVRFRRKRYVSVVVAHELLHFLFFAHLFRSRPVLRRERDSFRVWHASELFNAVVQGTPAWLRLFRVAPLDYPEHVAALVTLRRRFPTVTTDNREALITACLAAGKRLER
jgi:hypothetical protein